MQVHLLLNRLHMTFQYCGIIPNVSFLSVPRCWQGSLSEEAPGLASALFPAHVSGAVVPLLLVSFENQDFQ